VIELSKSQADYCWEKVAEEPDKYLRATDSQTRSLTDAPYAHGSGFVISREGYILTNAHVVSAPGAIAPPVSALTDPIVKTIQTLTTEFGSEPSEAIKAKLVRGLLFWFRGQAQGSGKFKEARVIFKNKKNNLLSWSRQGWLTRSTAGTTGPSDSAT